MSEPRPTTTISLAFGGLGDQLCLLAAIRAFAETHPGRRIATTVLPDLVAAYRDDVVRHVAAPEGEHWVVNAYLRHRVRHASADGNYLGTYMAALGMTVATPPAFRLPLLEPHSRLIPGAYVALQPRAVTARNPADPDGFVARLVERVKEELPGLPVVAVGDPRTTPRSIHGVDFGALGSAADLVRVVSHAAFVLTPRSASAHVAAAHGVPALVWTPGDGEEWHLDYPSWPHVRASVDDLQGSESALRSLLRDLRMGRTRARTFEGSASSG